MRRLTFLAALALACGSGLVDHAGAGLPPALDGGCTAPLHACGGSCVAQSVQACGSGCATCTPPPNAQPVCAGGECGYTCAAPFLHCATGCCTATRIAAGGDHTCALVAGGVKCWGANDQLQLGSANAGGFSATPVDVPGLSGASDLASGAGQTCAIVSGAVKCWGLGQGVEEVGGVSGAVLLAVGGRHACAATGNAVLCWGANDRGQLGDGTLTGRAAAAPVSGASGALSLALGLDHSCAAQTTGALCWGRDDHGQVGDGQAASAVVLPTAVQGLSTASLLGVGAGELHSCALASPDGSVSCWGANARHQVDSSGQDQFRAKGLGGLKASAVAGGAASTCAIVSGGLECWGANDTGQLALGDTTDRLGPTPVPGLSGVSALALGSSHGCALFNDGSVQCWGKNNQGQLGTGSTSAFSASPVAVSAP